MHAGTDFTSSTAQEDSPFPHLAGLHDLLGLPQEACSKGGCGTQAS